MISISQSEATIELQPTRSGYNLPLASCQDLIKAKNLFEQ